MGRTKGKLVFGLVWVLSLVAPTSIHADSFNVAYGKDEKQKLDVYSAKVSETSTATPVVIWVHGGGWRTGDKDNRSGSNLCQTWSKSGITMVNLNYRLSPDVVHPAHVEDIASGIAWVTKNIAKHGGDPKQVYLLGHSAGAHLVALVATAPEFLQAHQLTPKQALAGVMAIDTASYDLNATGTPAVRKMIRDAFGESTKILSQASPLIQAKAHKDECPPFIIATVRQRPEAVQESKALEQALSGSQLILKDYPGTGQLKAHGNIARDLLNTDDSMTKQLLVFVKSKRGE